MPLDGPWGIAELGNTGGGRRVIRLPELDTVPVTAAVATVIDHPHVQRLRRVRQLGPICLVYPGATHTRFEHVLGVYGTVIRYLRALLQLERIRLSLSEEDVRTVLMAGLLHDIGHYPFAHTLEALHRRGRDTPRHEDVGREIIFGRAPGLDPCRHTLASLLRRELRVEPERVVRLMTASRDALEDPVERFLQSIISGALDADKMDYLWRDSVHLGVPYGRNYDRERLLNTLTLNCSSDGLAVTEKGVTSAQVFMFCRYTMFSEVYWHHTTRSFSAMLEAAWADLVIRDEPERDDLLSRLLSVGDDELLRGLSAEAAPGTQTYRLLRCITRGRRMPFRRLMTWSRGAHLTTEELALFDRLYRMDDVSAEVARATRDPALDVGPRPPPGGPLIGCTSA